MDGLEGGTYAAGSEAHQFLVQDCDVGEVGDVEQAGEQGVLFELGEVSDASQAQHGR